MKNAKQNGIDQILIKFQKIKIFVNEIFVIQLPLRVHLKKKTGTPDTESDFDP